MACKRYSKLIFTDSDMPAESVFWQCYIIHDYGLETQHETLAGVYTNPQPFVPSISNWMIKLFDSGAYYGYGYGSDSRLPCQMCVMPGDPATRTYNCFGIPGNPPVTVPENWIVNVAGAAGEYCCDSETPISGVNFKADIGATNGDYVLHPGIAAGYTFLNTVWSGSECTQWQTHVSSTSGYQPGSSSCGLWECRRPDKTLARIAIYALLCNLGHYHYIFEVTILSRPIGPLAGFEYGTYAGIFNDELVLLPAERTVERIEEWINKPRVFTVACLGHFDCTPTTPIPGPSGCTSHVSDDFNEIEMITVGPVS